MSTGVALRHPLSGTLYEQVEGRPGVVRVVGADGIEGFFDDRGNHLEGARRTADGPMCRWVADGIPTAVKLAAMQAQMEAAMAAAADQEGTPA